MVAFLEPKLLWNRGRGQGSHFFGSFSFFGGFPYSFSMSFNSDISLKFVLFVFHCGAWADKGGDSVLCCVLLVMSDVWLSDIDSLSCFIDWFGGYTVPVGSMIKSNVLSEKNLNPQNKGLCLQKALFEFMQSVVRKKIAFLIKCE